MNQTSPESGAPALRLLSVVVPARDEAGSIATMVENLHHALRARELPHEIVVVDDGSTDRTWEILGELRLRIAELVPVQNAGAHGYGRAVACGLEQMSGDAVVIMMADESDDPRDAVRYWDELNAGYDCVGREDPHEYDRDGCERHDESND